MRKDVKTRPEVHKILNDMRLEKKRKKVKTRKKNCDKISIDEDMRM